MRLSIRFQLMAVLALLAAVFAATHLLGHLSRERAETALSAIYGERVVPLRDLKTVADAYAVDIVDATHKLRGGAFDWAQADRTMRAASARIAGLWGAYAGAERRPAEQALIARAVPLLAEADAGVETLLAAVAAREMAAVEAFARDRLYQSIDPISAVISDLIALQVDAVASELSAVDAAFARAGAVNLAMIGLAAAAIAGGAAIVQARVAGPIREMTAAMKRIAGGDLDAGEGLRADAAELGAMADALGVFVANGREMRRLAAEREAAAGRERAAAAERAALQTAVAAAVERAAAGDFAARVEARYQDEALNGFACHLNELMETVGGGVGETAAVMAALARGDLGGAMDGAFRGAFAELQANVNGAVGRMRETVIEIKDVAGAISASTAQIAGEAEELSSRAENQAASLEQIAATMEQMASTVKTNAENAASATRLGAEAAARADRGGAVVAQAVDAMSRITDGSRRIADIVSVIDGFAFQTNLLALNAAVEAARAGEAGRGFAVVAAEVRTLAQRSAEAARDIKGLIDGSAASVRDGVRLVEETGAALREIVEAIRKTSATIEGISQASREQSSGVDEISAAIASMDQITQQNSALAEESASAAKGLAGQAARLTELTAFFTVAARAGARRDPSLAAFAADAAADRARLSRRTAS